MEAMAEPTPPAPMTRMRMATSVDRGVGVPSRSDSSRCIGCPSSRSPGRATSRRRSRSPAIATALAVAVGRGDRRDAGSACSPCSSGQLSVGWSNDYLDRERDRRTDRVDKPIVAGTVSAAHGPGRGARSQPRRASRCRSSRGGAAAIVHLGAVALAWAYNAGLKNTAWSVVPYVVAFGALPVFVTLGLPGHPLPPWWAVTRRGAARRRRPLREHAARPRRRRPGRDPRPAPPLRRRGCRWCSPRCCSAAPSSCSRSVRPVPPAAGRAGPARGRARRGARRRWWPGRSGSDGLRGTSRSASRA